MSQRMARLAAALVALTAALLSATSSASAGYGDVFVSNRNGNTGVLRIDAQTGAVLGTFAASNASQGLQFGPNGNLYVSSFTPDAVFQYDKGSGAQVGSGAFTSGKALDGNSGITFGPDGMLYAASFNGNAVLRYNGTTGAFDKTFATGVSAPYGIVFGPDGQLYVGDTVSNRIERYNGTTGAHVDTFVSSPSLSYPGQMTFGPDGNLYVASFNTGTVVQIDANSGLVLNPSFASVAGATGIAFGADNTLYVSSFTNGTISRHNAITGAFQSFLATGLSAGPTFLTVAPVPEPASIALTALGGGILWFVRNRRRRSR